MFRPREPGLSVRVELYNIARRAKKDVVMLVYGGNEPAAPWITSGLSFIDREKELQKGAGRKGS